MPFQTFGFVGLGLIGGSIAKAIRENIENAVIVAYDSNEESLQLAYQEGICNIVTDGITAPFKDCDIIFLCTPVSCNHEYLLQLKEIKKTSCIITDVGSVKNTMAQLVAKYHMEDCFIGGHPMAGSEHSGFAYANPGLLENAFYILTPSDRTPDTMTQSLKELVLTLGAIPLVLDSVTHDHVTAAISHLPHMIAFSLVNLVKQSDNKEGIMRLIAAGGFKDITRIASSSPIMWQQICMENKAELITLMDEYIATFTALKDTIQSEDTAALHEYFEEAGDYRNSFDEVTSGPISRTYYVSVYIPDEAGAIATISGLFAKEKISIKNIGIIHNREFEEGALRIEFYDEASLKNAITVLGNNKYHIFTK